MTSNNTSCLVSTSSRNASITPRKIVTKVLTHGSPEINQNQTVNERVGKTYLPNSKIQRNKIRPKAVKLSNKHKIVQESSIRGSSGSNRSKFVNDVNDPLNNTNSKNVIEKDIFRGKLTTNMHDSEHVNMPMVIKSNPGANIYGSVKKVDDKNQKF